MSAQQATANADPELSDIRYRMRHSAAHVMAEAVIKLFPEAQIAIGPPTDDGFYYDFEVSRPFTPEDLEQIEGLMRETIAADRPFTGETLLRGAALERFSDQKFKVELKGEGDSYENVYLFINRLFRMKQSGSKGAQDPGRFAPR